jgi:hypothetical protein
LAIAASFLVLLSLGYKSNAAASSLSHAAD